MKTELVKWPGETTSFATLEIPLTAQPPVSVAIPQAFECIVIAVYIRSKMFFDPVTARCDPASRGFCTIQIRCLDRLATQTVEIDILELGICIKASRLQTHTKAGAQRRGVIEHVVVFVLYPIDRHVDFAVV